jgi:uncharacterized RDD family membrane protein YckC
MPARQAEPAEFDSPAAQELAQVEPGQPIHANLIEFPRELVATRKVRLREAHVSVEEPAEQLSIFEVDPGTISTEAVPEAALPRPSSFEWSGIKLDAQPAEEILLDEDPAAAPATIQLAPFSRRLMAAVVDGTLITGAFLGAALVAASHIDRLPELKILEAGSAAALLLTSFLYQLLFSTLASATPGMKYAGISLCTFDDQCPNRTQRFQRLGALLLSILPVGLGLAWAIFDEEHLSWHDRLSKTYHRRG